MTVWTLVLWKTNIQLAKIWPEMVEILKYIIVIWIESEYIMPILVYLFSTKVCRGKITKKIWLNIKHFIKRKIETEFEFVCLLSHQSLICIVKHFFRNVEFLILFFSALGSANIDYGFARLGKLVPRHPGDPDRFVPWFFISTLKVPSNMFL